MFEQTFVQSQAKTRKPWTVAVSLSLQCGVIAIILLIPLLHPDRLRIPELPKPKPIATWVTLAPLPVEKIQARTSAVASPRLRREVVWAPPIARTTTPP